MKKFGLSKHERIKREKDFKFIYSGGKVIYSGDQILKAIFRAEKDAGHDNEFAGVKIAAAVSKKAGNAVWRNRFKRLIKDAYRNNKHSLVDLCITKNIVLKVIFSPNNLNQRKIKNTKLVDILPAFLELIKKIESGL